MPPDMKRADAKGGLAVATKTPVKHDTAYSPNTIGGYKESRTVRGGSKRVHHLEIHPHMGGGVVVQHHYHQDGMTMTPAKHHHFAAHEAEDFHAHIAQHTGMGHPMETEAEAEGAE